MAIAFVRIPKTGSRSIKSLGMFICEGHESIEQMKKRYEFDSSFAGVRNPYDRAVSAYTQGVDYLNTRTSPYYGEYDKYPTFTSFWMDDENNFLNGVVRGSLQKKNVRHSHYHRQSDFVTIDGKLAVNWILRFEYLQTHWWKFLLHRGLEHVDLPHVNKTEHHHWKDYYVEEVADKVYEFYKEDFDRFEYRRDSWRHNG